MSMAASNAPTLPSADIDVRVIDQRIGVGIGGLKTVIRLYHKPTGILIEVPSGRGTQLKDYKLCLMLVEMAVSELSSR